MEIIADLSGCTWQELCNFFETMTQNMEGGSYAGRITVAHQFYDDVMNLHKNQGFPADLEILQQKNDRSL